MHVIRYFKQLRYLLSNSMNIQKRTQLPLSLLRARLYVLSFVAFALVVAPGPASGQMQPGVSKGLVRERILIDDDWRFQMGDPAGATGLLYDVRAPLKEEVKDKAPDAAAEAAEKAGPSTQPILKPWILPTGNRFVRDPAHRFVRPPGNPGGDVSYTQPNYDDSGWQRVTLPHDWAITGPFTRSGGGGMGRLPSGGVGWYRKKLDIRASDAGKCFFLDVDGAMSYAAVWINGKLAGGWPYGYASWRVDLTPFLVPGTLNQLAIRIDNPPESSRWYPGGGLYRNVWLTKTQPVHVTQWGTYVTTPEVSAESATVRLEVRLDNSSRMEAKVRVTSDIYELGSNGRKAGPPVASIDAANMSLGAGASSAVSGSSIIRNPKLWGPPPHQQPNLYIAVTKVWQGGSLIDMYETQFGIRSLRFDPNSGLYVNGEHVYLKGANMHHDLGALGSAFNVRAAQRQLETLREMGCNAIRTSHNPPDPELLDLADRMGFLIMDEIFDVWYRMKTPYDFHMIFADWHEQDLRAFMQRDRNRPSVFLWSVGNEVGEQYTGADGAAVASELVEIAHQEDSSRPVTASMNYAKPDMPFSAPFDVISLNYQGAGIRDIPSQYQPYHEKYPKKLILSSESAAAVSSRGVYLFPVTKELRTPVRDGVGGDPKTHQVSSYDLYSTDFGSSPDRVFASQDKNPYSAGEFVWSGWDYLGEPSPYYSSRSSYFGIIDLAGFKKDRFYLYQAEWRPDLPMAHILPHWTWPERVGQVTPVHVYTSGDQAELFLNGKSLGRKKKKSFEYRLRWDDVIYQPGELKVVAYKNGKQWATDVVRTASQPEKLSMSSDVSQIVDDGRDLAFVTVRVADRDDATVPRTSNHIAFSLEGPGEIVAIDNGDPTNLVPFPSHERDAFNGMALAIIRAKPGQTGAISVYVKSAGLKGASVMLHSVRGKP
jgi:beta-galactosidase